MKSKQEKMIRPSVVANNVLILKGICSNNSFVLQKKTVLLYSTYTVPLVLPLSLLEYYARMGLSTPPQSRVAKRRG